jgi:tetratricopeptide (TPR) repeat protein
MWTKDESVVVAGVAELAVDLHAAWDHAAAHDRGLAVQLAADVYDYAYLRQRLDMLDWGLQVASWDIEHPDRPRALAAASAAAWAGGRLDEAWEHAVAAGDDHPSCGRALTQSGNLAMFASRNDDALARFRAAAELHRRGGEVVRALMDEVSVEQARTYGGHAAEAAGRMEELVARAVQTGCPSALCWAYYVAGLAVEYTDVDRAQIAYAKAVEHGNEADCRLLVMIARSYALSLVAAGGALDEALREFQQVFEEWEGLGNEMIQWWMLSLLVLLLARAGADLEAAVLAGAVVAARDRQPLFPREIERFDRTVEGVRDRLGGAATDRAMARGAELTYSATVAHARGAIAGAQHRRPT